MKHVTLPELRILKKAGAVLDTIMRWNGAVVELDVKLPVGRATLVATRSNDGQPRVRQFRNPEELQTLLNSIGIKVKKVDFKSQHPITL
jgi:hypothetical protein